MSRTRLPLVVLLLFAALCGVWLLALDPRTRFTTDVTELLPAHERDPEARLALSLVRERQSRVLLVVLDAPPGTPPGRLASAAEAHAAALRASPAIADAHPLSDRTWQHALGKLVHDHRLELLLPAWLAEQRRAHENAYPQDHDNASAFADWLAERAVATLDERLASPEGGALVELVRSDPLLLLPDLAERASNLAATPVASADHALIWAETVAGPLTEEGQSPVFAALAEAEAAARELMPEITTRFTGVHRFAAEAKASTREDISRLNTLAVIAVLVISALFVRKIFGLLHLLPIIFFSTLGAVTITTAIFPRVHVLVFVLGSLLSGVAVDYAYHIVLARREGESYAKRIRRILHPLLGGAGTTVAGFLALVVSELPLVRQLGVYVAAGIVIGLACTLLYLGAFTGLNVAPRQWRVNVASPRRWRPTIVVVLAAFAIFGLTHVRWHDDLRTLEYPAPELRANDASIRELFGDRDEGVSLITRGGTLAEARTHFQQLVETAPDDVAIDSLASLLPTPADYATANDAVALETLRQFVPAFTAAAERAGYEPDAFEPFLADLARHLARPASDYEALIGDILEALPGPLAMLAHHGEDGAWFLSRASRSFALAPELETISLSGIESLNNLFARYRAATGRLSFVGIAALVVISCGLLGWRTGLRTAALPLLATALAFGLLALRGEPFGLFHLLGALLGVCLADDYAHFAHTDDGTPDARASIRLSALTTAASFATLAFSAIPAVSSLGLAVSLIVVFALVFVETDLFSLRRHA